MSQEEPMYVMHVHGHEVNAMNDALAISADAPGDGGASHRYRILWNPTGPGGDLNGPFCRLDIVFQDGPIGAVGLNGVSNEALLAIVRHRLKGFQSGQFACRENALALTKLEEALHWLLHRTRERGARGVEGTHEA